MEEALRIDNGKLVCNSAFCKTFIHCGEPSAGSMPLTQRRRSEERAYISLTQELPSVGRSIGAEDAAFDQRVIRALKIVSSSSMTSISVKTVAAELNISPSRFRDLFKEQVGMPFHKYDVSLRLERAWALINTTACTAQEAARSAGFTDMCNFHRAFKRHYGVTPGSIKARRLSIESRSPH
jgi:AraC-like DNA-binding protein